ncbi:MAG TPA: SAM-dependent methyltransferase [Micromonosporaceae bacterium]|jgi:hypothetical protein|nr:SAM-dependent methyltransferase [Micromonosporaceae bacterium]
MTRPDWSPSEIDLTRASAARIYDYNLGGSHNFAVDREVADRINRAMPDFAGLQRANRAFLRRAVKFIVNAGIRQLVDLGSGIPTVGNVHEIAQGVAPESRVVYVDIDSVAVIHSNAILKGNDRAAAIQANVRDVDQILATPTLRSLIDFSQPTAVLMASVLHYIPDDDEALGVVRTFRDVMSAGSYLMISHGTLEGSTSDEIQAGVQAGNANEVSVTMRSRAEIIRMFEGFDILEPGVVFTPQWRPDSPDDEFGNRPDRSAVYAAVGRKR